MTAAAGGTTWLMYGSLAGNTMVSVRQDAECPSISPDHTRVAFKIRQGQIAPGTWHVAVLDLATGHEQVVAENRSIDDQVEWLDNDTLLYQLPRQDTEATNDIWQIPADGSGSPSIFIPKASSLTSTDAPRSARFSSSWTSRRARSVWIRSSSPAHSRGCPVRPRRRNSSALRRAIS